MNKEEMLEKAKLEAELILLPAAKHYARVMMKDVLVAALKDVVEDSSNPYDDMVLAALLPMLDAKMEELLK